jgi:hypothetical protein
MGGRATHDKMHAAATLVDFPQLTLLDAAVRRRKTFTALGLGLSVEELTPRDRKAYEELADLVSMVFHDDVNMKIVEREMQ